MGGIGRVSVQQLRSAVANAGEIGEGGLVKREKGSRSSVGNTNGSYQPNRNPNLKQKQPMNKGARTVTYLQPMALKCR